MKLVQKLRNAWSNLPLLADLTLVYVLLILFAGAILITLDAADWPLTVLLAKAIVVVVSIVAFISGWRVREWLDKRGDD